MCSRRGKWEQVRTLGFASADAGPAAGQTALEGCGDEATACRVLHAGTLPWKTLAVEGETNPIPIRPVRKGETQETVTGPKVSHGANLGGRLGETGSG